MGQEAPKTGAFAVPASLLLMRGIDVAGRGGRRDCGVDRVGGIGIGQCLRIVFLVFLRRFPSTSALRMRMQMKMKN